MIATLVRQPVFRWLAITSAHFARTLYFGIPEETLQSNKRFAPINKIYLLNASDVLVFRHSLLDPEYKNFL
jgi:hypothetical protein